MTKTLRLVLLSLATCALLLGGCKSDCEIIADKSEECGAMPTEGELELCETLIPADQAATCADCVSALSSCEEDSCVDECSFEL